MWKYIIVMTYMFIVPTPKDNKFCSNQFMLPEIGTIEIQQPDTVRDLVKNSPINFEDAVKAMSCSKDVNRDAYLYKELSILGVKFNYITKLINGLNKE